MRNSKYSNECHRDHKLIIRSVMALIRGTSSLFPCPRCLISWDNQGDPSARAPLRTVLQSRSKIEEARGKETAKESEEVLKAVGLRDVDVRLILIFEFIHLLLTSSPTECILEVQMALGPIRGFIF
jgi:hypothetical protein